MVKKVLSMFMLLVLVFSVTGCSSNKGDGATNAIPPDGVKTLEEMIVATPPGPISYCLAYMLENQPLDSTVKPLSWNKYDQLLSAITAKQVHIAGTPLTNAIMLYNKGFDVKLINVSVWGMLYVLSPDNNIKEIKDLAGQEIAISGQGGIHDLVFKHLLIQNGLDPATDITITYMDLPEASAKLATGEMKFAVLNEPNSSMATMNAKKGGVELFRVLDLQKEWGAMTGNSVNRIPQAGFIMVGDTGVSSEMVLEFNDTVAAASKWINDNPETAGPMVEKYFEWMKAPAVQQSLKFARLEPKPALECKEEIENFFTELLKTAPAEAIGGKLPDEQFYFQP